MGAFQKAVTTKLGDDLLAKAVAGSTAIEFTKLAVSENVLSGDLKQRTTIGTIKQEVPAIVAKNGNSVSASGTLTNEKVNSSYAVRNIGLFATDPDLGEILFSVSVADETVAPIDWIPAYTGTGISSLSLNLAVALSNEAEIEIVVTPADAVTVAQLMYVMENMGESSDLTYTEEAGEVVGDPPEIDPVVQNAIDEVKDDLTNHSHTAEDVGALPNTGGILSGDYIGLSGGYGRFASNKWNSDVIVYDAQETGGSSTSDSRRIKIYSHAGNANKVGAIQFADNVGGTYTNYLLFGEHNKPSGSYTGNGSATSREIAISGVEEGLLLVQRSNNYVALVTSRGALCYDTSAKTTTVLTKSEVSFTGGKLTIATTSAFLNASSQYYYRQI